MMETRAPEKPRGGANTGSGSENLSDKQAGSWVPQIQEEGCRGKERKEQASPVPGQLRTWVWIRTKC